MAEPNAIISNDEPFDCNLQAVEDLLMADDDAYSPLSFIESEVPLQQNDFPVTPTGFQSTVADPEIVHPSDPFFDSLLLELDNEMFEEGFQTGTSRASVETDIGDNTADGTNGFGNPIQHSPWPLQVPPNPCSYCHILREIVHTNGVEITKLEVHGRLGLISHAVLEKHGTDLTTNQDHEYKMFDFCKEPMNRVKQFLVAYCKERTTGDYVMLQDPLSSFYEAICVGLDWEDSMDDDLIPDDSGDHQTNQQDEETSRARLTNKTTISMKSQRERTGKLTMKDLVDYFHSPIEVAAKKIHVCPTVIKKICRKHGLLRWPYRKIKSIKRKISARAKCLISVDAKRAQDEIDTLRQEITNIYAAFKD